MATRRTTPRPRPVTGTKFGRSSYQASSQGPVLAPGARGGASFPAGRRRVR